MLSKKISILSLFMMLLSGCVMDDSPSTKEIVRSGIDLIVMDEGSKVTYIKDNQTVERFCASREIDSVKTFSQGVGLGVATGVTQESISEEDGSGSVALGGRSPAVLITREMMFRACELALNLNLDSEKTIEIYKMFLEYTNKLIKNEHDQGSGVAVSQPMSINNVGDTNSQESDTKEEDDDEDDDEK